MLQLAISCHHINLPVRGLGCIQLSCCLKGSQENPQTTQAVPKTMGCFRQIESRVPMLKTTATQFTDFVYNIYSYVPVSLLQKGTLQATQRKNTNTNPTTNLLDLQCCPTCKICQGNSDTSLVEVINQSLILLKT